VLPVALLPPPSKIFFQTTRLCAIIKKLQQSLVQNADWFRLIRFSTVREKIIMKLSVVGKDAEVDKIYDLLVNNLMETMSQDAAKSTRLARLLFAAKNLERIGDYVKDICELTVYMKEAVFIKHQ
jgi:Na+/phosphate symporter